MPDNLIGKRDKKEDIYDWDAENDEQVYLYDMSKHQSSQCAEIE